MRIQVKLGGDLKRYARDDGGVRSLDVDGPVTVSEAMASIGIEEQPDEILVIVNDEVVPPAERASTRLTGDDRLALMPQLKGG